MLTPFRLRDVAEHLAGEDDEHFRRFEMPPSTDRSVRLAIRRWQRSWRTSRRRIAFAVRLVETGELAGGCELRRRGDAGEVAYWVFAPYRGRGIASRSLRLLCRFSFDELGVTALEAHVARDNMASQRTALVAGFELVKTASTGRANELTYRRIREHRAAGH